MPAATGFAGMGGAATGVAGFAVAAGAGVTEPPAALTSRIFCSISCGVSFGPATAAAFGAGLAFAVAATGGLAAAGLAAGALAAAAGLAPPERIAAMMSLVDVGFGPGAAAGFGGVAAVDAAKASTDEEGSAAAGDSGEGAIVSAGAAAAAAFWARILARISAVEGFFSSMVH